MAAERGFHTGTARRAVTVNATCQKAWSRISRITDLSWVTGVRGTSGISRNRTGNGAARRISFDDGSTVEEHIVGWKRGEYFSYVAVSGLPLRAYHATIRLEPRGDKTRIIWQSYFNSKKMTGKEFSEFVGFIGSFYASSLRSLKRALEA